MSLFYLLNTAVCSVYLEEKVTMMMSYPFRDEVSISVCLMATQLNTNNVVEEEQQTMIEMADLNTQSEV